MTPISESKESNEIFIIFDMVHYTHTHIIEAIFPYNNGQKDLGGYNNEIYMIKTNKYQTRLILKPIDLF